jgi:hypothetical protein
MASGADGEEQAASRFCDLGDVVQDARPKFRDESALINAVYKSLVHCQITFTSPLGEPTLVPSQVPTQMIIIKVVYWQPVTEIP